MPSLELVRGDRNYYLEFEVKNSDGSIIDITGCTVSFKMQKYGESTLTLDKEGSVPDGCGTLGLCQVFIQEELVNKSGEYSCELQISWSYGRVLTSPMITAKILKDLPR